MNSRETASPNRELALLITGASGSILPARLIPLILRHGRISRLHLVMSSAAGIVAATELDRSCSTAEGFVAHLKLGIEQASLISCWENSDLAAPIASGSHLLEGVIVLPCSAGTAGSLAHGISRGLIQRVGDVALKQRQPLIIGIRETPMSEILLENLLRLSRAGALIMPPIPNFYLSCNTESFLDCYLDAYCLRILDVLGIDINRPDLRWKA